MKLYRAALKALEACEVRDKALAHRDMCWQGPRAVWNLAQAAYVRAFTEALEALEEYRAVRDQTHVAPSCAQCDRQPPWPKSCDAPQERALDETKVYGPRVIG